MSKNNLEEIETQEFPSCCCNTKKIIRKPKSRAIYSSKVKYISQNELNKLNNFLRSIVGISCLNLDSFTNRTFNICFINSATTGVKGYLDFYYGGSATVVPWINSKKIPVTTAFNMIGDLLGVKINVVTNSSTADYLLMYTSGIPAGGDATFPYEMDYTPEFLNNQLFIFFSNEYEANSWDIGTFYYSIIVHLICHTLGLAHPYDNGNNSLIMPGISSEQSKINQGIGKVNNTLTTILTDYQIIDASFELNGTIYPRTLMSLDLEGLKFYYNFENTQTYIDKWLDLTGKKGITQTWISTKEGLTLNLTSTEKNNLYNLILTPFVANINGEGYSPYDLASSVGDGYIPDFYNTQMVNLTFSFLEKNSFIKKVNMSFNQINVYAENIKYDIELNADPTVLKIFNLFLKGKNSDYTSKVENNIVYLTNNTTGKTVSLVNIFGKVDSWNVKFSINN